jgi:anti-sigma regulatory factor (Ser/Thr protein kinase)
MSAGFEIALTGGVDAARAARLAVAEHHPALAQRERYDLALLVTEVVTNAVRDGGAAEERPLRLECRNGQGRIRVEVIDPGTDFDSPARPAKGPGNGGWGLFLLDRLAESWGIREGPAGTCVWFEMPLGATR